MSDRYGQTALLDFLKQAGMNGLINPATARSRRLAAEMLLSQVNGREANDLREIDLDDLCARFHKLETGALRPEVVELYRGRLKSALRDFFAWIDSPDDFKSTGVEARAVRQRKDRTNRRSEQEIALEEIELSKSSLATDLLPIPIRPDRVVYVQNLPLDLSANEAKKIAAVIEAMSNPSEPLDD